MSAPNPSIQKLIDRATESLDQLVVHAESLKIAAPNEGAEVIFKQIYYTLCGVHTLLQISEDMCIDDECKPVGDYFDDDDEEVEE